MKQMPRRTMLHTAWIAPTVVAVTAAPATAASTQPVAGTVNTVFSYTQYPGSVNWTFSATNTSGTDAPLTVVIDPGPYVFNGWLSQGWSRSGWTFTTQNLVAASTTSSRCTIAFGGPSQSTATIVATISAPGARPASYPFALTITE